MTEQEWREEFSRFMRKKMREKDLNQKQLSAMTDISEASIGRYASGTRTPSGYAVKKIIDALR